jgi:hypothetical protein
MLEVGIISSDSTENKLYYQVNQRYEYYVPLKAIFGDSTPTVAVPNTKTDSTVDKYMPLLEDITGLRLALFSGVLVKGSSSAVDVLLVGNVSHAKVKSVMTEIEKDEGREINYSVVPYDEFYYRLSIRDRFITEIINGKHAVVIDKDEVINKG